MNIQPTIEKLCGYVEGYEFKGWDPYDGLNSPFARLLSFNLKAGRIAWTQFFRRCPVNLRPLLLVPRQHNPKGIGLFLWGYAKLFAVDKRPEHLATIHTLLDILENIRCPGYSGNCWGYNFDWQQRTFFLPKQTPTIVNSSFIGHALLDTHAHTGSERALDMALSIREFILRDLNRTPHNGTFCFSYTPLDRSLVHNANLLGASFLARLHARHEDPELQETALQSLGYTISCQQEDGSWFHGETEVQRWKDSFHTGFNLQAIRYFLDNGLAGECRDAYERGVTFYESNYFLEDGTPKYYHDRTYPVDIHCPAQAVVFFSSLDASRRVLADKVLGWMLAHLYDANQGYFYFRKGRIITNRIPYMRWGQAWAFHALTEYHLNRTAHAEHKDSGS